MNHPPPTLDEIRARAREAARLETALEDAIYREANAQIELANRQEAREAAEAALLACWNQPLIPGGNGTASAQGAGSLESREPPPVPAIAPEDLLPPVQTIAREDLCSLHAPPKPPDPALGVDCPRCKAPAGSKCKNYRGQNKAVCSERGKPAEPEPPPAPPGLQDHLDRLAERAKGWTDEELAEHLAGDGLTLIEKEVIQEEVRARAKAAKRKKKAKPPEPASAPDPAPAPPADLAARYPGGLVIIRGYEWCRIPGYPLHGLSEEVAPEAFKNHHLEEEVVPRLLAAGYRPVVLSSHDEMAEYPLFGWASALTFGVLWGEHLLHCSWYPKADEQKGSGALIITAPRGVLSPVFRRVLVEAKDQWGHPEALVRRVVAEEAAGKEGGE